MKKYLVFDTGEEITEEEFKDRFDMSVNEYMDYLISLGIQRVGGVVEIQ